MILDKVELIVVQRKQGIKTKGIMYQNRGVCKSYNHFVKLVSVYGK